MLQWLFIAWNELRYKDGIPRNNANYSRSRDRAEPLTAFPGSIVKYLLVHIAH